MAGDWIKVEKATARKPEILRIAASLGIHPDHAFGLCIRFWCWCDENLENGNARSVTGVMLDALLDRDGFATALQQVGWLAVENDGLSIPNYGRHLDSNAKKRALSKERTRNLRSRKCNADSVTEALPEKRREEKRREEKKKQPAIPHLEDLSFVDAFDQFVQSSRENHNWSPSGSTTEAWLYELSRFSIVDAIAIVRFSTAKGAKTPITNGDHKTPDRPRSSNGSHSGYESNKEFMERIIQGSMRGDCK